MKLPSIEGCPKCSRCLDDLYRDTDVRPVSHQRQSCNRYDQFENRLVPQRVFVHQRLGPMWEDPIDRDDYQDRQWCPSGIFTKTQKRRAQRMRFREIKNINWQNDGVKNDPKTKKVWRPKLKS